MRPLVSTILLGPAIISLALVSVAHAQSVPRIRVDPPRTLLDGSQPSVALGPHFQAAIGPRDAIALADGNGSFVGILSANSQLRRLGREGDGPGEFRRGLRVGWRDDALVVTDAQARRTTLLRAGRVVQTVAFRGTSIRAGVVEPPLVVLHAGAVCPVVPMRAAAALGPRSTPIVLTSLDGRVVRDSLFTHEEPLGKLVMQRPHSTMVLLQPFSAASLVYASGNGAFLAHIDRRVSGNAGGMTMNAGRVTLWGSDGRPRFAVPVPLRATPLDARMIDHVVDTVLARLNESLTGSRRVSRDDYRRALATPAFLPAVASARVTNSGEVLLRAWGAQSDTARSTALAPALGASRRVAPALPAARRRLGRIWDNPLPTVTTFCPW